MAQQYRHEKIGVPPRGWRVRTVTQKQHQVRIAFPPGPRKKGTGRVVEILHPLAENAACNRRSMNPILESILGGIAAGASVVTTQKFLERRKKKAQVKNQRRMRGEIKPRSSPPGSLTPQEAKREMRRMVGIAYKTGGTVPYSLSSLLSAGIGLDRIRAVYRGNPSAIPQPRCGADWKKSANSITDRAHRYRAQRCAPGGVRKCVICASKRFLVVDHRDGDETNDAPRNLRWLCKSCNNRLSAANVRSGRGRPTRQFNAGAKTLGAYVAAATQHRRGAHDAGGRIIHETPKARRQEYAAEIWRRRRRSGNPNDNGAEELYESFHGRSPTEVLTMQEECVTAGTYAALGKMRGLWLEPAARKNQWGRPHIEFSEADGVKLASAPGSTQLYLIGGNQQLPLDYLASRGADTTKEFIPLGTVYAISYLTEKSFDGFRSSEYIHELGEETGERPTAFYNKRAKRIILVGGAYSIAPTDNRLGASPGIVN